MKQTLIEIICQISSFKEFFEVLKVFIFPKNEKSFKILRQLSLHFSLQTFRDEKIY